MSLQAFWGRQLFRCWASLLVMIGKRFANQPGQLVPARVGYVGQHGVAARGGSWPAMDSEASTTPQLSFYAAAAVPPSPVCSTQSQTLRFQLDQFFFPRFHFCSKNCIICSEPVLSYAALSPNVFPVLHKSAA